MKVTGTDLYMLQSSFDADAVVVEVVSSDADALDSNITDNSSALEVLVAWECALCVSESFGENIWSLDDDDDAFCVDFDHSAWLQVIST